MSGKLETWEPIPPVDETELWIGQKLGLERGPDIRELQKKRGAIKSLAAIGQRISSVEAGHRERLYVELGCIFAVARFLENDIDAWTEVCADEIWEEHPRARPSLDNCSLALVTSLRLAIGLGSTERKRVSLFKRALQGSFDRGASPPSIPDLLREAGGPEALAHREAEASRIMGLAPGSLLISVPLGKVATELSAFPPKRRLRFTFYTRDAKNGILHVAPISVVRRKLSSPK